MDEIVVQGRLSQGYGVVPKLVMRDERISIQAKAIYAYFCSYAGMGTTAFPKVQTVVKDLGISKETFNKYKKQLEQYGYLKTVQTRNDKGTFAKNVYTLCEVIEEPRDTSPSTILPSTALPSTISTVPAEVGTNNNIYINNNNNNNNGSKNNNIYVNNKNKKDGQSVSLSYLDIKKESSQTFDNLKEPSENKYISNYNSFKAQIQENIEYRTYTDSYIRLVENGERISANLLQEKIKLIDDFIEIMLDTIFSKGDVKIGNEVKSRDMVESTLLKLDRDHIEFTYKNYNNTTTRIKNKKAYILTILYNSYYELVADVANFSSTMFGRK